MNQTCLVIPCFNEAERLDQQLFVETLENRPSLTLIFVDDGSIDNTLSIFNDMKSRCSNEASNRFHILHFDENAGKSEAVRQGLILAINLSGNTDIKANPKGKHIGSNDIKADYYGFWDADLATPLDELDWFFQFMGSSRPMMVIGSRVARMGATIERTIFRHYSGRLFATLISQGLKWKVHDTQCGAKIINSEMLLLSMREPFKTSWLFDVEMLLRLQKSKGVEAAKYVLEVPIRTWNDVKGSKIGFADFAKVPYQIWKVFRSYK